MIKRLREESQRWGRRCRTRLGLLILSVIFSSAVPGMFAQAAKPADLAYLGVSVEPKASKESVGVGLAKAAGLKVNQVIALGPAAQAGIRVDDSLVRMDDQWLVSADQLRALVQASAPGQPVRFEVSRAGESLVAEVVLGRMAAGLAARPGVLVGELSWENWSSAERLTDTLQSLMDQGGLVASALKPPQVSPGLGVEFATADTNLLASLELHVPVAGVITSVAEGSFGAQAGLQVDDVLVSLNRIPLFGPDDVLDRMQGLAAGETLQVEVVRNGMLQMLEFSLPEVDNSNAPAVTERRPDLLPLSWTELIQGIERKAQVVLVLNQAEAGQVNEADAEDSSAVTPEPEPEEDTYISTDGVIVVDIQKADGQRYATITTPTGGILFRGMIDLPEERAKLPRLLLRRVDALLNPVDWSPPKPLPGADLQVRELPVRFPTF